MLMWVPSLTAVWWSCLLCVCTLLPCTFAAQSNICTVEQYKMKRGSCGASLANMVQSICKFRGGYASGLNFFKRAENSPLEEGHKSSPFLPAWKAKGFLKTEKRTRTRQGIVCECCVNRCSMVELSWYCNQPMTKRGHIGVRKMAGLVSSDQTSSDLSSSILTSSDMVSPDLASSDITSNDLAFKVEKEVATKLQQNHFTRPNQKRVTHANSELLSTPQILGNDDQWGIDPSHDIDETTFPKHLDGGAKLQYGITTQSDKAEMLDKNTDTDILADHTTTLWTVPSLDKLGQSSQRVEMKISYSEAGDEKVMEPFGPRENEADTESYTLRDLEQDLRKVAYRDLDRKKKKVPTATLR